MPDGAAVIRYEGRHGAVTWRLKFKDANDKQVMQTLGREADGWTEQKAERELGKRLELVQRERWRQPDEITFRTFAGRFMDEYLPGRNLKPTTVTNYRGDLDNHLLPAFGHLKLIDLEARPDILDAYVSEKTRGGLSAKTITNHLLLLNVMLRRAVVWRLIRTNPVSAVDRPRVETPEMGILTEVEVARLTAAYDELIADADDDDRPRWMLAKTITLVALGTALRRGELLALTWTDIELLERRLHVRRPLVRGKLTTPKSKASRRTIQIGPRTTTVLADWWRSTPFRADDELVFPNPHTGNPADASRLSRYMRRALRHARITKPFRPFQDLRHSSLTAEAAAGNPSLYVQFRAGHAQASITERYLHAAQVAFPGAAEKGEARIFGPELEGDQ